MYCYACRRWVWKVRRKVHSDFALVWPMLACCCFCQKCPCLKRSHWATEQEIASILRYFRSIECRRERICFSLFCENVELRVLYQILLRLTAILPTRPTPKHEMCLLFVKSVHSFCHLSEWTGIDSSGSTIPRSRRVRIANQLPSQIWHFRQVSGANQRKEHSTHARKDSVTYQDHLDRILPADKKSRKFTKTEGETANDFSGALQREFHSFTAPSHSFAVRSELQFSDLFVGHPVPDSFDSGRHVDLSPPPLSMDYTISANTLAILRSQGDSSQTPPFLLVERPPSPRLQRVEPN